MKLQDPLKQHPPFDVAPGQAAIYLDKGYVEIQQTPDAPEITVNWSVQRGRFVGDYECPPLITYSASNGTKGFCESTQGTAHRTVKVLITGQKPAICPSHIGEQYTKLFEEWAAKSRRRKPAPAEKVSPNAGGKPSWSGAMGSPWQHNVELRNK